MRPAIALFSLCLAAQARADACPTAADLAKGIRLSEGDVVSETFRQLRPGLITSVYSEAGTATRALLLHGLYMVEILAEDATGTALPGSRITFSFPDPPGGVPDPAPGVGWEGVRTMLDGDEQLVEPFVVRFGPWAELGLGDCSYRSLAVTISYPDRDPPYFEELTWIADLGLSFLSATAAQDGSPISFRYDRIEALP